MLLLLWWVRDVSQHRIPHILSWQVSASSPAVLFLCRRESSGTKVWKEYLSFTFELSSLCPEAYSSLKGGCISSSSTARHEEVGWWAFYMKPDCRSETEAKSVSRVYVTWKFSDGLRCEAIFGFCYLAISYLATVLNAVFIHTSETCQYIPCIMSRILPMWLRAILRIFNIL